MTDRVTKAKRSSIMSRIRSRGNRSTEVKMRMRLVREGISGWEMHSEGIEGLPDFYFADYQVAVFVDGCFWHGCPQCYRKPKSRTAYWDRKLERVKTRDDYVGEKLRGEGITVIRIWEHEVADELDGFIDDLRRQIG